jgi:hypothetical protein
VAVPDVEAVTPAHDELICRQGQLLPGLRLKGPPVCLSAVQWADLKARHLDVSPDGKSLIRTDYEKVRALTGHACESTVTGSATAGWVMGIPLCF